MPLDNQIIFLHNSTGASIGSFFEDMNMVESINVLFTLTPLQCVLFQPLPLYR